MIPSPLAVFSESETFLLNEVHKPGPLAEGGSAIYFSFLPLCTSGLLLWKKKYMQWTLFTSMLSWKKIIICSKVCGGGRVERMSQFCVSEAN